ncbi:DEAD/DEAH box helicase [Pseudogracilibacillus sp. ICA-222130]|uniref:DEAD/DEAH box helicase n=1 Tax=Pseudogracilibacillus sp. ICA-222130 TaxID=3134655 RepID=UPI0030C0100D
MKHVMKTSPYGKLGRVETLSQFTQFPKIEKLLNPTLQQFFTGKLLRKEELSLEEQSFQILWNNGYFKTHPAITKNKGTYMCHRCHNRKNHLFGVIPCQRCHKTHVYCRNCIMMGRMLQCDFLYEWIKSPYEWPKMKESLKWDGTLSHAQQYAAKEIVSAVENNEQRLIWAVTGAGKTEMLFLGLERAFAQGKRVCLASPRMDVVKELIPRFTRVFPHVEIEALHSDATNKRGVAQFIISTTHQLLRFKEAFDVVIIDEVDAFPYYLDPLLQFATKRAKKQHAAMIYLTATPRKDFLRTLRKEKVPIIFVPVRYHLQPLPMPTMLYVHRLTEKIKMNQPIKQVEQWLQKRKKQERQVLIFMPSIQQLKDYKETVCQSFLHLHIIKYHDQLDTVYADDDMRDKKIERFRNKELKVLMTTTILERGVTFPSVDVIILGASNHIFDVAALVQIAGRAGRSKDDPQGHVLYVHDGLTNAMLEAKNMIRMMNQKRKNMLKNNVVKKI